MQHRDDAFRVFGVSCDADEVEKLDTDLDVYNIPSGL